MAKKLSWSCLDIETMNCCGMAEIYGFPESIDSLKANEFYYEAGCACSDCTSARKKAELGNITKEAVIECIEKELSNLIATERKDRPYSHHVVTFIEEQNKLFGAMVKRLGFKAVGNAINGNTGNRVWMYVRMRPEVKKKEKKSSPKLEF